MAANVDAASDGVSKLSVNVSGPTAQSSASTEEDLEETEVLLFHVKECYVYKIPPRKTSGSHRADDWDINKWAWEGSLRVVSQGDYASIRLEDAKTGELFAVAPVRPGHQVPVEAVIDSSRFFVLRIEDSPPDAQSHSHTKAGCSAEPHPHARHAFIGLGFRERPLAFDFQEAVYDHVKYVNKKKEAEALGEEYDKRPAKDLRLKEGQTLHLSLKTPASKPSSSKTSILFSSPHTPGHLAFPPPPPPPSDGNPASLLRHASGDHTDPHTHTAAAAAAAAVASESSGGDSASRGAGSAGSPEGAAQSLTPPRLAPPPPPGAKSPVLTASLPTSLPPMLATTAIAAAPAADAPTGAAATAVEVESGAQAATDDDDFGDFVTA